MTTTPAAPQLSRHLPNGVSLAVYDRSKKLAGDRWLVRLQCEVEVQVGDEFWLQAGPMEAGLGARIREKIGNILRYHVDQQRTFVAEADRPTVVAGLLHGIEASTLPCCDAPRFPAGLFARRFAECKAQCLAEDRDRAADLAAAAEDDGPADFSHCFTD